MARPRLGLFVAAAYAAFFAATASLGLGWLDAGELSAAARALGVPHPTGYPLFALVGHAFAVLLPVADAATRVSLASSACAVAALWLAYRAGFALARATAAPALAAEGAGLLAAGVTQAQATFWLHAAGAEVYAAGGLCAAAVLALAASHAATRAGAARRALAAAAWAGLAAGAGTEARVAVLLPALALLAAGLRAVPPRRRPALLAAAGAVATFAACATVLYLPLRAAASPVAWGHPTGATALWAHLAATRIRLAFAGTMGAAAGVPAALATLAGAAGLPALALAAAAVALAARRRRRRAALARLAAPLWMLASAALYAALVNPMGNRDLQNGLVFALAVAALAAAGASALATFVAARLGPRGAFAFVAVAALAGVCGPLPSAATHLPGTPRPGAGEAVRGLLDALPPRALFIVESDDLAGGALYAQLVEGTRPDALVLVRQHAWDVESLEAAARRAGPNAGAGPAAWLPSDLLESLRPLGLRARAARSGEALRAIVAYAGPRRTVAWELATSDLGALTAAVAAGALGAGWPFLSSVRHGDRDDDGLAPRPDTGAPATLSRRAFEAAQRDLARFEADACPRPGRAAWARWVGALGLALDAAGDPAAALALLARAAALDDESPAPLTNAAVVAARRGDYAAAVDLTEDALARDPGDPDALVDGGRFRLDRGAPGDEAAALDLYGRARAVAPGRADAWAGLGILAARRGDLAEAERLLSHALALDPGSDEARINLGHVRASRAPPAPPAASASPTPRAPPAPPAPTAAPAPPAPAPPAPPAPTAAPAPP
ncbi:MAG TPA: DUF2723 domain-containing protein [Myxococcota bacterium]|jgi:tetratricopeptide (TPR) repeat protein|nr:DUF2723 domain-containing protein [Myxococcota bacterium]